MLPTTQRQSSSLHRQGNRGNKSQLGKWLRQHSVNGPTRIRSRQIHFKPIFSAHLQSSRALFWFIYEPKKNEIEKISTRNSVVTVGHHFGFVLFCFVDFANLDTGLYEIETTCRHTCDTAVVCSSTPGTLICQDYVIEDRTSLGLKYLNQNLEFQQQERNVAKTQIGRHGRTCIYEIQSLSRNFH